MKYDRQFKLKKEKEGMMFDRLPEFRNNNYYLRYKFTNDYYYENIEIFTKKEEFSTKHFSNLNSFYDSTPTIGDIVTSTTNYESIFKYFNPFISKSTLKYKDDIDAEYFIYIFVSDQTANDFTNTFQDNSIIDIELDYTQFQNYLYYAVESRKIRRNEIKIFECFDVETFLGTL